MTVESPPVDAGAPSDPTAAGAASTGPPSARPRRRIALWAALGVGGLAIALVALLATRPAANDTLVSSPLIGKQAPSIAGVDLEGRPISLASLRGRYVLVNFYASWCPPCRTESPQLQAFAFSHPANQRVAVLGVVFSDAAGNARSFEHEVGATWPSVMDPNGRAAIAYGVNDPPQSFLVAPDGKVVQRILGGVTANGLDQLVAADRQRAESVQPWPRSPPRRPGAATAWSACSPRGPLGSRSRS